MGATMSLSKAQADLAAWESRAAKLKAELAAAEDQIVKIRIYLEMARVYGDAGSEAPTNRPPVVTIPPAPSKNIGRPPGGRRALMEAPVKAMLKERGSRMRTIEILERLEAEGFTIGGESPTNNLSGILSRMDGVNNDRSLGWGLNEWQAPRAAQTSEPDVDATSASVSLLPPELSLLGGQD